MTTTRVMIVDDQQIFRVMLHEILSSLPDIEVIGEATNGQEAVEMAEALQPEVVLMDIEMGSEPNGVRAGQMIKSRRPSTGIVLFSSYKAPEFIVKAPGWSYLLKNNVGNIEVLVRAITGAAWGLAVIDPELAEEMEAPHQTGPIWKESPEPARVLKLMAQGYDDAAIAARLAVNERVVRQWQELIYQDMGIQPEDGMDTRIRAIVAYIQQSGHRSDEPQAAQKPQPVQEKLKPPREQRCPPLDLVQVSEEHKRVLALVAEGFSDTAIADTLMIDERSVREYLEVTYYELGIGAAPDLDPRVTLARAYLACL